MQTNRLPLFPLLPVLFLLFANGLSAQQIGQTLRGTVLDKQAETPLIGATIELVSAETRTGTTTDANGKFTLKNVPIGRQQIRVTYLGYYEINIPNILVTAGKEVVLDVRLEESLVKMAEVVVTAKADKDKPVNELAAISARQFNVEEVRRYSGGRNDVSKLVANFAGVAASNDQRNDIVIRGNSPTGVLWRLEGVPIPSPNHFSTLGTTGGPVSALNPNIIANSDFLTSAFSAEYGNALAGVFDIGMRTGNKERLEFTGQVAAFSGFEGMIEGPVNRKNDGSFLVAYRHSFVEVAHAAGLNIGTTALPAYKDLSFNLDLGNTRAGKFSLFGIGGTSNIEFLGKDIDTTDIFAEKERNAYNKSRFGVIGLKHHVLLNDHSYLRTIVSASHAATIYEEDDLRYDENGGFRVVDFDEKLTDYRVSSYYNNKINKRVTLRTGVLATVSHSQNDVRTRENTPDFDGDGLPDWYTQRDFDGNFTTAQAYAQTQVRVAENLTLNAGLHGLYFDFTEDFAAEPRLAANWNFSPKQTLSAGYGLHHQTQPLPVFLFKDRQPDGSFANTNGDLGFTRSHHFVLGYDLKPAADWRVKAEAYFQSLDNVPVESFSSSFSILNAGADFVFPEKGSLVNDGTGRNYGIEFTLEKFFSRNWYTLVTASIFDSKYKGSDGVERNTAFNGKYVFNALAGREFKFGKNGKNAFTLDTKVTAAGGRYDTPVNLPASIAVGEEVRFEDRAYSERYDPYFRWDVKLGIRTNSAKRKLSQTFFLDFQNVTNHKNIFRRQYSSANESVGTLYQIGFFPDVLYRVEF